MKGRDLCEQFFMNIGLPAIRRDLPECTRFMAAGMFGGSQCHGNDDEISRDHAWGPGFGVWLSGVAHERFARSLQEVLDRLPQEYNGLGWSKSPKRSCAVEQLDEYVTSVVGCATAPERDVDWLHIPEEHLFEITHRPVFYDATEEATKRFQSFEAYPSDVWKKRLSACLAWLGEWGAKHLPRAEARGDEIAASMYWCRFSTYAMKVGFLLAHQYAPYHKWLYREFSRLSGPAATCLPLIQKGHKQIGQWSAIASQISEIYQAGLHDLGLDPVTLNPEQQANQPYPVLLHQYAQGVKETIGNPDIKKLYIHLEVLSPPSRPTWMAAF